MIGVFGALVAGVLACSPAPTPAPSPPAPALPALEPSASASAAFVPVPPPPPPPRFRVPAPFVLVARGDPTAELRPFATRRGVLLKATSPALGAVHFAAIEGDQARLTPELDRGFPPVRAGDTTMFQDILEGDDGTRWAHLFRSDSEEGQRHELWRHAGEAWALAGTVNPGESGVMVLPVPWAERLLAVSHASASMTPLLQFIGPGKDRPLPQFTSLKKHPKGCLSHMTSVTAARAWASGEVLAVGTSCWIPTLQIERWAPGKTTSEAREIKGITIQDPTTVEILSPDEIVLDLVTVEPMTPENNLSRVRLLRKGGAWRIQERTVRPLPVADPADEEAARALEKLDAALIQSWTIRGERYHAVAFPRQGPPIEQLLVRRAPLREAVSFPLP